MATLASWRGSVHIWWVIFKRLIVVAVLLLFAVVVVSGRGGSSSTATGAEKMATSQRKPVGRIFECKKPPLIGNRLRVSGGASCAQAVTLFHHPLRGQRTFKGWHCNQQSLGRYGPVLNFCAHGRNKRVSYIFKG